MGDLKPEALPSGTPPGGAAAPSEVHRRLAVLTVFIRHLDTVVAESCEPGRGRPEGGIRRDAGR